MDWQPASVGGQSVKLAASRSHLIVKFVHLRTRKGDR